MKKRLFVLLSVVTMALPLVGCDKKDDDNSNKNEQVKIGVLVSDVTSAEAIGFRSYYENYIANQYNVKFIYSDELKDAAAEASAIDNFVANNCKAVISFASADRPAQIRKCQENKVYYSVATGTLTDEEYETFKGYEYYVGAIGPDLVTEYQTGYNMAKYYLDAGKTQFALFGGAIPYFTDMHIYRAAGMLAAMAEKADSTFNGATGMGIVGQIYQMGGQLSTYDFGDVDITGYVGGYDFDDAWFGKLAAAANSGAEVLLAVGSGQVAFGGFVQEGQELADIDSFTADSIKNMEDGKLNYLAGKFSSSIGPIFAATYSAVKGNPIRDNGNALALSQGFWVATDATQAKQFLSVDSSTENPAYNKALLDTIIGADYQTFASFVAKFSFEEIQNLKK